MPHVPINIPHLLTGVSTRDQARRSFSDLEESLNATFTDARGVEKRAGTQYIQSPDNADGSLTIADPSVDQWVGWIDFNEDERFMVVIDHREATPLQVFDIADGSEVTVNWTLGGGAEDPKDYLKVAVTNILHRYRMVTVADSTLILNRDVTTALKGSAVGYDNSDGNGLIRATSHPNNYQSWRDFPQPPSAAQVAATADIFYARDDDLSHPAGFWTAASSTVPPWYTRLTTESADSEIDFETFPLRMDYNGTDFTVSFPAWEDRLSGDSFTNAGPTFIGKKLADIAYLQNRLWFGADEEIYSSQVGDVFNLWRDSYVLQVDSDPIIAGIPGDKVAKVRWLVPFDGSLVVWTDNDRQFEIRSPEAFKPSNTGAYPTTAFDSSIYFPPIRLRNQLYTSFDKNGRAIVLEYAFDNNKAANAGTNITEQLENYIVNTLVYRAGSAVNDMLFFRAESAGENDTLYVNQQRWENGQRTQNAWGKWEMSENIKGIHVFGSELYLYVKRDSLAWLQKVEIDLISNSSDAYGSLAYGVRLDRQLSLTGVYDSGADTTTWTLPFIDTTIDTIVMGPGWDNDYEFPTGTDREQRIAGKILLPTNATSGTTTLTVPGQFQTNASGDDRPAFIGRSYEKRITLSDQFVRDQNGQPAWGNLQLRRCKVRVFETGSLSAEVTPQGRDTVTMNYIPETLGVTEAGNQQIVDSDEFTFFVGGSAHNTQIDLVNDSPLPSRITSLEFDGIFQTPRTDPGRN